MSSSPEDNLTLTKAIEAESNAPDPALIEPARSGTTTAARKARWREIRPWSVARAALIDFGIVALFFGLPFLFYWRVVSTLPTEMLSFAKGDFSDLHFPYRLFVSDELARGVLPGWNPYLSSGHPSLGDIQFGSLYPIGEIFARLAGGGMSLRALELQTIFHFSLAGVFMYLFARWHIRGRFGAVIAALAFTFGGYLTDFPVQQMILLQVSVWLPLVLLFLDLSICFSSPLLAIPAGGALAMAALAGHPQTLFYVMLGAGLFFLFRSWEKGFSPVQLVSGAVFVLFGLGLAAPQLIPAYQHLALTDRSSVNFDFTTHGFRFFELVGIVMPYRFGGFPLYYGVPTLVLAGLALFQRTRRKIKGFWLCFAVLSLLLGFGGDTFLQQLSYLAIPPLKFRNHERYSFLFGFAVAMLGGFGAAALRQYIFGERLALSRERLGRYLSVLGKVSIGLFALTGLYLFGAVNGFPEVRGVFDELADRALFTNLLLLITIGLLALAFFHARSRLEVGQHSSFILAVGLPVTLAVLLAVDLFSIHTERNTTSISAEAAYPNNSIVQAIKSKPGLFRVASEGILPGDGNAGSAYRYYDVVGNSPLELASYQRFQNGLNEWQRFRLLGVRFLITKREISNDPRFEKVLKDNDTFLYEIPLKYRLPRAWVARRLIFAGSEDDALRLLATIDPLTEAVVHNENLWSVTPPADSAAERVEVVEFLPDSITIDASLAASGLLVVSEIDHPDWRAWVDGQPTDILRVDSVLRGVWLEAGEHKVEMRFESAGYARGKSVVQALVIIGLAIVVFELLARALLLVIARRRLARGAKVD